MALIIALLLPVAVLLLALAGLFPRGGRVMVWAAAVLAGVVVLLVLINGVDVSTGD